jgi:hypothetical protein
MNLLTRPGRPGSGSDRLSDSSPSVHSRIRRLGLTAPDGISHRLYFPGLLGPLLLSAGLGVQLTLAAILFIKPPSQPTKLLTRYGIFIFRPDRDVPLYLAGNLVTLGIGLGLVWAWNRRLKGAGPRVSESFLLGALALQSAVALGGTSLFLNRFMSARRYLVRGVPIPTSYAITIGAIALVSAAAGIFGWIGRPRSSEEPKVERILEANANPKDPGQRFSLLDLAVPVGILLVIYVPFWRQMAGRNFIDESLFHWDFYAMGPAVGFSHGRALGSQIFAMYGVGWPMVFGGLTRWIPLSYGHMIQIGSLYACLYLTGAYLLLRLLVRRPALAAAGTGLMILQFFLAQDQVVIWRFPSLTVMRWPCDIWCFLCLVMYWRSRKRLWAVAAGAVLGLAFIFSIDTGLYLAAGFAFWWLASWFIRTDKTRHLTDLLWSAGAGLAVLVAGLEIAGRGHILSIAFIRGSLESILEFGGGYAQLPMATVPNAVTIVAFSTLFFGYLAVLLYCVVGIWHQHARQLETLNGGLAVYGLLTLLHFVGRSGDYTPFRLFMPMAIILTVLVGRASTYAGSYIHNRWGDKGRFWVLVRMPWVAAALAVGAALIIPRSMLIQPLLSYPNLISAKIHGHQPDGLCLLSGPKDICGLPADLTNTATVFRAIADRLHGYEASGHSVGVVDESGSLFYLASDTTPWGRYTHPFISIHTTRMLGQFVDSLNADPPDYILTRMQLPPDSPYFDSWPMVSFGLGPSPDSPYSDIWDAFLGVLHRHYRLEEQLAPFEIWRLAAR